MKLEMKKSRIAGRIEVSAQSIGPTRQRFVLA
jgi:hypothetical protein